MGKVKDKDGVSAAKAPKPAKGKPSGGVSNRPNRSFGRATRCLPSGATNTVPGRDVYNEKQAERHYQKLFDLMKRNL